MRRLIFLLIFGAGLALWRISPAGLYLSAALLGAAILAAAENLLDKREETAVPNSSFIKKGEAPLLILSGKKRLTGRLAAENILTGQRSVHDIDLTRSRTADLGTQEDCGGLFLRFISFYRYDLLGLTRRVVVCSMEEHIAVLPDPCGEELAEMIGESRGESELDGAREYLSGDSLRRVNFKLTHRFGRIYINSYAPESSGRLILFADIGLGGRAAALAELMCGLGAGLNARGISYDLALPDPEGGVRIFENAYMEERLTDVLTCPLAGCEGESRLPELLDLAEENGQIAAFTENNAVTDERLTIIS